MKNNDFIAAIQALGNQEKVPVLSVLRDPVAASVFSKLIPDDQSQVVKDDKGNRVLTPPDINELRRVSNNKIQDITDAESAKQMLPDLELAEQILVSSILSPKDMMSVELIYQPPVDIIPPSISATMTNVIKGYVSEDYKIESRLPRMLKDILFNTGSYPVAVIPENSIDMVINSGDRISNESIKDIMYPGTNVPRSKGLLGPSGEKEHVFSLESFASRTTSTVDPVIQLESMEVEGDIIQGKDTGLFTVTDNTSALSLPALLARLNSQAVEEYIDGPLNVANEELNDTTIEDIIYQRTAYSTKPLVAVKSSDQCFRESVGEPLIMHFPSESVIPVFIPGSPSESIGFFVLLDNNGYPISRSSEVDHYRELGNMTNFNKKSMASNLLERANQMYFGGNEGGPFGNDAIDYASRAYGEIIETDLIQRLRNGIYGQSLKIGTHTEIYRIMFSRALQQQHTQLLFIPGELMTYMAYRHDKNGVGYSLLDNLKTVNSLAVHLLLADIRAGVMNSIPRTKVDVKLDEDEPNTIKRRTDIIHEFLLLRSAGNKGMPMGTSNPTEITNWANHAGVEFHFSGAKDMPDMDIDISEHNTNITKSDPDLRDEIKRLRINGLGLSPETVDATLSPDFARSVTEQSLMLSRRALNHQEEFLPYLTDHLRKCILNSPRMVKDLLNIVMENFEEIIKALMPDLKEVNFDDVAKRKLSKRLVKVYINKFEFALPKPSSLSIENKKEAFSQYVEALDDALQYYISQETLPSLLIGDEGSGKVDEVKQVIKAYYVRRWMAENDYMSELSDLVTTDDEDNPLVDIYQIQTDHAESVMRSIAGMLDKSKNLAKSTDAYFQANDIEGGDSTSDYSSDTDSAGETSDDGFGDFSFGEEDSTPDEESGTEENTEETTEEETTDPFDSASDGESDNAL